MTDAPPRRRARAPILSPIGHAASPPTRGYPLNLMAGAERPPVRRNLFGSQISSRGSQLSSRMGSSQLPSSQTSPDVPSFPPNGPSFDPFHSRDPTRRPSPRRMSIDSSGEETIDNEEEEERQRQAQAGPPRVHIPRNRAGSRGQSGLSVQPPQAPPRMGRVAPAGMRRPSAARTQRFRRSDEDEIVVRDASGDFALSDPVAVIMAGRRTASTMQGHEEVEHEEGSDSDEEAAEERRVKEYEEAERKRIAEAIKHYNRQRSRGKEDPAALLNSVKARMKEIMMKLEDDEWMYSAGEHK